MMQRPRLRPPTLAGLGAAVLVVGGSCAGPGSRPAQERIVSLQPFAAARAPYSPKRGIALVSDSVACVVDGYHVEIYCTNPDDELWKFGRKGEGPGELQTPLLRRGPGGTVAAFDLRLKRVSVFQTGSTGATTLVSSSQMPRIIPATPLSSVVAGRYYNSGHRRRHEAEVDVSTGRFIWDKYFSPELVQCGDGAIPQITSLGSGHPLPGGGIVFVACQGQKIVWFADRDDSRPSAVIDSPTFRLTYPSEREVARYIEGVRAMTGGAVEPSRTEVEEFRSEPRPWSRLSGHTVDEDGRLWVATTRDREEFSYSDVYGDRADAGTVRVRHSMVAFDRLGSRLVVLVDRPLERDDPNGVARRGIDWYDVSGLQFTSGETAPQKPIG